MKCLGRFVALVLLYLGGMGPFAVGDTALHQSESHAIEIEDVRGAKFVFEKPVDRIVCLLDSALTGLYMLDAEQRLVGVSMSAYTGSSAPFYAAMDKRIREKSLPAVSQATVGSLERIISLKPELVIVWSLSTELIAALEERNIPVFGVFIDNVEDIYKEIRTLGELTGTGARARELVDYTRGEIQKIEAKVSIPAGRHRPSAYFMWANGELDSAGGPSIVQKMLDMSGADNICGRIGQEHVVISMEHLLEADPEVMVMWYNEALDPADISKKRAWRGLAAVKNNRVHEIPDLFAYDLCTLNFQLALKLMARWCHPEAFDTLSLVREVESLFETLFLGKLPPRMITGKLSSAGIVR